MGLPKSFKQAAFKEAGGPLVIEETPLVLPKPGEILVKVEACGVCFSDHVAQQNYMGGGFPLVPGHEIIGRVAAVGDGVSEWALGERIGGGWHGAHDDAEYCTLRAEAAVRVPDHVDAAKYAPMLCAGVTVFNSMRRMNIGPGKIVAIQGLGGLGHLAIQYANKFGYRVVAMSRDSKKEKFARSLGAHEYIDASKEDVGEALQRFGGAAMIVLTAPNPAGVAPLIKGLDLVGKLLILSTIGEVPIDTGALLHGGNSVHAWPSGHATDSREAIEFAELQGVNCLIEEFPLEKANEAYGAMLKGTVRFRAVITMK
ncbi:hypothetical protein FQN55_007978 [Onygenales sp. PD_40]|nr:hypothetical protein FQN55_007978 [Onygenales sp. PD_40]